MATKPLRSTAPAHSILSTAFDYKPSAQTDLRKTFARVRREQEAERALAAASNVKQMKAKVKA